MWRTVVYVHMLKNVYENGARQGGPKLERYVEARQMASPASQAICARCEDAERMFSLPFMDRKGYTLCMVGGGAAEGCKGAG